VAAGVEWEGFRVFCACSIGCLCRTRGVGLVESGRKVVDSGFESSTRARIVVVSYKRRSVLVLWFRGRTRYGGPVGGWRGFVNACFGSFS
jgi:hypothetical protein